VPNGFERLYIKFCNETGIQYFWNYQVENFNFDFYLPESNTLVELDSEFWHCFEDHLTNDRIQNEIARRRGYRLLRLSSAETKNPNEMLDYFKETFAWSLEVSQNHNDELINARISRSTTVIDIIDRSNKEKTINCMICNKSMKRITRTHLVKHGITTDDYKQMFPGSPIVSEELSSKLGDYARSDRNHMKTEEFREWSREIHTGKSLSDETRSKISAARIGVSWGSHTDEHKEHIRQLMREDAKRRLAEGIWPIEQTEEIKEKNRIRMKEAWANGDFNHIGEITKKNWEEGKFDNTWTDELREEASKRATERLLQGKFGKFDTSIELKMKEFLKQHGLEYDHQFVLADYRGKGRWIYDFHIPSLNLLLEVDGEFFHSKIKAITRDQIKEKCAYKSGYNFLRISDKDWRPELVLEPDVWESHSKALMDKRLAEDHPWQKRG